MRDNYFWDKAWISEESTERVKLIDLIMHKTAVDYTYSILGNLKGKKLLEIGCGSGAQTIEFIHRGAVVTAIDISEKSVELTKHNLKQNNAIAVVKKTNAEKMDFPNEFFDAVYINCVLMHANQNKTIKESLRVLKTGGQLVFKETLKQWIAATPYRIFSPYMKTKPHYITLNQVKKIGAKHREFYLLGSFFLFLFYLFKDKTAASRLFNIWKPLDNFLLKHIPWLRTFAWVTVGTITKR